MAAANQADGFRAPLRIAARTLVQRVASQLSQRPLQAAGEQLCMTNLEVVRFNKA